MQSSNNFSVYTFTCTIFSYANNDHLSFSFSDIKNNEGRTPLDVAVQRKHTALVDLLLKSGTGRQPRGQFVLLS